jgi:hypothetical protein
VYTWNFQQLGRFPDTPLLLAYGASWRWGVAKNMALISDTEHHLEFLQARFVSWICCHHPVLSKVPIPLGTSAKMRLNHGHWRVSVINILCHVDPLLRSDYTAAVARQRPINKNRGVVFSARSAKQQLHWNRETVFSVLSLPRCYKQGSEWGVSQSVEWRVGSDWVS